MHENRYKSYKRVTSIRVLSLGKGQRNEICRSKPTPKYDGHNEKKHVTVKIIKNTILSCGTGRLKCY